MSKTICCHERKALSWAEKRQSVAAHAVNAKPIRKTCRK